MWQVKLYLCALCLVSLTAGAAVTGVDSSPAAGSEPQAVVHHPDQSGSLEARWQWALAQIPAQSRAEHIWLGFSTRRLMPENAFVGRWPVSRDYPTLSELVYGVRVELPRLAYSRQKTPRIVAKEVAYLFEVERASGRLAQAQTSDVSLSVYLMRGVLFWLGEVGSEQAAALFQSLCRGADDDDLKIQLVAHIAEAQDERAPAFLDEVLQKEKSERVRREAVRELGRYESQKSLEVLLRTVQQDSSEAVRREAVGTLGHLEAPGAEKALLEIARAGPSPSVRREAIQVSSRRASPALVECLGGIINGPDQPRENQRAALEALARMENPEALDMLLRLAQTHANVGIRHQAIDELRGHPSAGVIRCLAGIVNQDQDEAIQRRALEVLAQMESREALGMLIGVAQTHTNPRLREHAMDRLRGRTSPEVRECLLGIINSKEEPEKIQAKALETLVSIEDEKTLETLMSVARTHRRPAIRQRALEDFRRCEEWSSSSPAVLECLVGLINRQEESPEIQRRALDQLAEYRTKEARDALMQIATAHAEPRMRESAVDKLGNVDEGGPVASPDVNACLGRVLNKRDEQERIQRKALDVLTRGRDAKTQALLIRTATTHANPRIRQEAIDRLGQTEEFDAQALAEIVASLEGIVDNPQEQDAVQRKALDALKNIEHPNVLAYLKKAAQSHPNRNIRRQAQELLAQKMTESWNREK